MDEQDNGRFALSQVGKDSLVVAVHTNSGYLGARLDQCGQDMDMVK